MTIAAMPSVRLIERSLRIVTERLPVELSLPAPPPPHWSELEWKLAPAVAAMHGVSSLLGAAPLWDRPASWRSFLQNQRAMTIARHRRIAALLAALEERARRGRIALMPLKGAALYALGLYALGERPMADIDLLVDARDLEGAARLVDELGYRSSGETWKHRAFEPAEPSARSDLGEHAEGPIKIDLHIRIAERLPLEEHDFTALVWPARPEPGLNGYPSLFALMLHLLAHTAGTMVHRGVRLIQLEDIARLARRMTGADWDALLQAHGAMRRFWWAPAPLLLARRYLSVEIPDSVLARLTRDCPRLLRMAAGRRTLTGFSYSHARIDPAPGIVFARSGAALAGYVASRVRPSRAQLAQLDFLAHTGPWSAEPAWYAQSQGQRMFRWLTSRPLRTETMQPVRAALALRD